MQSRSSSSSERRRASVTMDHRGSVSSCESIPFYQAEEEKSHQGHSLLRLPRMTSSLMKKISLKDRKAFRVAILGARSVGKSAMTVRIKTRKFIHNYAPNIETNWKFDMLVDGESATFEIRDTAALQTAENSKIEEHIKWADAYILAYSVTDEESLSALIASKVLINMYAKRKKKTKGSVPNHSDLLVALVGNKNDLEHERMISEEQGRAFAEVHECSHFFELSTRESFDSVKTVFDYLYRAYRIKRSKSPQRPTSIKVPSPSPSQSPFVSPSTEDDRILKYKQRGRTKTTISTPPDTGCRLSPVTFRKIAEEKSVYSSSPDEDHTFVGEEIIYQDSPSSPDTPKRRVTVHSSPYNSIRGFPSPNSLRRLHSETEPQDSNNNSSGHKLKIPIIKLSS